MCVHVNLCVCVGNCVQVGMVRNGQQDQSKKSEELETFSFSAFVFSGRFGTQRFYCHCTPHVCRVQRATLQVIIDRFAPPPSRPEVVLA